MENTKLVRAMAGIVIATCASTTAIAESGFYAGANVGRAKIDVCGELYGLGTISCKDEDTAWKAYVGYSFNANIAVEGGWVGLGEVSGDTGAGTAKAEVDGYVVNVKASLPLSDNFDLFGKVGAFFWETDYNGVMRSLVGSAAPDGTDAVIGIGVQYMMTERVGLIGELERYDNDSEADVLSGGLLVKF